MTKLSSDIIPANVLVRYLWLILQLNDSSLWNTVKYGGRVPIIPNSQEPEFDQFDGPHIVYSYAETGGDSPEIIRGTLGLVVYDQELRRMNGTVNTIRETFLYQDESAARINDFSSRFNTKGNKKSPFLGIRFLWTKVAVMEAVEPERIEGGRESTAVMVNYEAVLDLDVKLDLTTTLLNAD